jgi:predicted helicase
MIAALHKYVEQLRREHQTNIAGEHAYRPALKELLESVNTDNQLTAVNDPERTKVGAPDFILMRDKLPMAYVEAKDIGIQLDKVEDDEQMRRYKSAFHSLILTDYLEFRWYVGGEKKRTVQIGALVGGKLRFDETQYENAAALLRDFVREGLPTVESASELAGRMADMTGDIRVLIERSLPDSDQLKTLQAAFQATLIPDLTAAQFADMVAQTLAYGLFAARFNTAGAFTRKGVSEDIPRTNPFLRKLFAGLLQEMDTRVDWMIDTLVRVLNHVDTGIILRDFGRATRQQDPVLHFYETFLARYDPKLREQRGVYYTPEPVVGWIVRSVDGLLRSRFKRPDGLADKHALILDPAVGTATFLYAAIKHIYKTTFAGQEGAWRAYVSQSLLPRVFGFELLIAPYAVAHMKIGVMLKETGYTFNAHERLNIFLTNTLEEKILVEQPHMGFNQFIAEEANAAEAVKRDKPIMVVMGNPPYSGHSENNSAWIAKLIRDYYQIDGQPLGERNSKWLQDDYVKFIRFGEWRISQTGEGVLAFVTNHGYLDNPTFRGMRRHLLDTFSDIYILDLHGSSKRKERAPDGGKDENVFDIQQGVAIGVFIKKPPPEDATLRHPAPSGTEERRLATIHHADLWGSRADKYTALDATDLESTHWTSFTPQAPYYMFTPQNADLRAEYERGWMVTDIFPVNVLGFQTHRDHFAVSFDRATLIQRIDDLRNRTLSDEDIRRRYHLTDNRDWKLQTERTTIQNVEAWEQFATPVAYRPFDERYGYFHNTVMDYPRRELTQHVFQRDNYCLLASRQQASIGYRHCWVAVAPANDCVISTTSREANQVFPVYIYPKLNTKAAVPVYNEYPIGKDGRVPNLNPKFVRECEAKLGMTFVSDGRGDLITTFAPDDVFHYAYAVFHSPSYRARYANLLKIDFPRLPLTTDAVLFRVLCGLGARLVDLHLLRGIARRDLITRYPIDGDNVVGAKHPQYDAKTDRVWINKTQFVEGVDEAAWNFHIGGYQVLEKWLKDRRGRALSDDDLLHYQQIVVALTRTQALMDQIDETIPSFPLA